MVSLSKEITIYNNTSLVCQSNFVAAMASSLQVFNTYSIKTNTSSNTTAFNMLPA